MEFGPAAFAALLRAAAHKMAEGAASAEAVSRAGDIALQEIRSAIGTYKYGWPSLSESTLSRKAADTPLLETGKYRESFEKVMISKDECEVGSSDYRAKWHEFGTSKMPPRPVIEPAAAAIEQKVLQIMDDAMIKPLKGLAN